MRRKGEEYHDSSRKVPMQVLVFCACAGVMLYGISAGIRSDIGILLNPIVHSSGQSYEDVSFAIAIMQLMFGASQPFFGILSMRRSNRLVLMIGICSYVIGLCMLPFVQSLPAVITSVGFFLGAGAGAISFGIILTSIVSLVGKRNAMIISGILNASSGLGSTFFSPVMQSLLSIGGLPFTSLVLCIPTLILLPITYVLTRADSKKRQHADKDEETEAIPVKQIFSEAFANPSFRLLICGFSTCGFHMVIIEAHLFSQFLSYGIEEQSAAWAFGVYGIATICGAMASGILCNHLHKGKMLGCIYGFRAIWVPFYLFLLPKTLFTAVVFAIGLGLTGDATVSPTSGIVNDTFTMKKVATLIGFLFFCHQIGAFFSAWLGGICVAMTGNYILVWILDIVLCLFASAASFKIPREEKGVLY